MIVRIIIFIICIFILEGVWFYSYMCLPANMSAMIRLGSFARLTLLHGGTRVGHQRCTARGGRCQVSCRQWPSNEPALIRLTI